MNFVAEIFMQSYDILLEEYNLKENFFYTYLTYLLFALHFSRILTISSFHSLLKPRDTLHLHTYLLQRDGIIFFIILCFLTISLILKSSKIRRHNFII